MTPHKESAKIDKVLAKIHKRYPVGKYPSEWIALIDKAKSTLDSIEHIAVGALQARRLDRLEP